MSFCQAPMYVGLFKSSKGKEVTKQPHTTKTKKVRRFLRLAAIAGKELRQCFTGIALSYQQLAQQLGETRSPKAVETFVKWGLKVSPDRPCQPITTSRLNDPCALQFQRTSDDLKQLYSMSGH